MTQIACRGSLLKCQIPDSFNETVLMRNSTPFGVCSKSSNDLCLHVPDKDLCFCLSGAEEGGKGGKKGKLVNEEVRMEGLVNNACDFDTVVSPICCQCRLPHETALFKIQWVCSNI